MPSDNPPPLQGSSHDTDLLWLIKLYTDVHQECVTMRTQVLLIIYLQNEKKMELYKKKPLLNVKSWDIYEIFHTLSLTLHSRTMV